MRMAEARHGGDLRTSQRCRLRLRALPLPEVRLAREHRSIRVLSMAQPK